MIGSIKSRQYAARYLSSGGRARDFLSLMPIQTALWKVGHTPVRLTSASLPNEQLLEQMIVANPKLLSDEWMLIGQQENTGYGGRVDLVAITPDASLVLIELKRDRTPREVVAQALDYATWLGALTSDEIGGMYKRFSKGGDLLLDFRSRFGTALVEEELNQSHQIIVVASSLDDSTERIVRYLSDRNIAINILTFQVFSLGAEQILSRTWLIDPAETQVNAASVPKVDEEPWNGEFYASFGEDKERSWEDAVRYGFISAGGGVWYTRTLALLKQGDRVWVNIPGRGYVGVCIVLGRSALVKDFCVQTTDGLQPILGVDRVGNLLSQFKDDPGMAEFLVPVKWLQTVQAEDAIWEAGFFGNQNSICQPKAAKWRFTVDRLKEHFSAWNALP